MQSISGVPEIAKQFLRMQIEQSSIAHKIIDFVVQRNSSGISCTEKSKAFLCAKKLHPLTKVRGFRFLCIKILPAAPESIF